MTYRTCIGCIHQKQTCAVRDDLRKKLEGLRVTSIKWKCKSRVARLAPGDPVWALTVASTKRVDDNGEPYRAYFPGIAIKEHGTKMLIHIAPGAPGRNEDCTFEGGGFCKIPLSRIEKRDGERVEVCRCCQQPAFMGHIFGAACNPDERADWF